MNTANKLSGNCFKFNGKHRLTLLWELRYKPFGLKPPVKPSNKETIGDNPSFQKILENFK